jgi:hypothetical protein
MDRRANGLRDQRRKELKEMKKGWFGRAFFFLVFILCGIFFEQGKGEIFINSKT